MSTPEPTDTPRQVHPWVAESGQRVRFGVFGGPLADWSALLDWVQAIEGFGFDSWWVGDHTMLFPLDCWTALAAAATRTARLRLGPLVSCVYYRPPALLARQAADIDRLSDGRLVLGLGVGDYPREFQQLGLAEPPMRERALALVETIALVRRLWAGEAVTMAGAFARTEDAQLASLPVQRPHVPLLIAGGGERVTLRMVAEHADMSNFGPSGVTGSAWGEAEVRRKLAALDGHLAAARRPPEAVLRSHLFSHLLIAETERAVEAKVTEQLRGRPATEAERRPGMPRLLTTTYPMPTVEHIQYVIVAGTPDEVATHYRALVAAGLRYFIAGCRSDTETLRLLAEQVAPQVA